MRIFLFAALRQPEARLSVLISSTYHEHCGECYGVGPDGDLEIVWEIAELAVINNELNLFNKSIQLLHDTCSLCPSARYKSYRRSFFELCRAFQRHDFEELLSTNECQNLCTESISETKLFAILYRFLRIYTRSENDIIESAMKQIPDIQRIVNAPDDNSCRGFTPLQSSMHNLSAVRTFIDVGADIDQSIDIPDRYRVSDKTLLMYVLNDQSNEKQYFKAFRGMLELLLYENASLALNDSAVSFCLKQYQ